MQKLIHNAMAVLLSGVVLASSVLPPLVCHAHVGGEQEHSHHAAEADHHHSGVHAKDDRHRGEDEAEGHPPQSMTRNVCHLMSDAGHHHEHGLESPVSHLHVSIGGFDFSLPLPIPENSNGPLSPVDDDAGFTVFGRLTDDFTVVSQVDLASVVDVTVADSLKTDVPVDDDTARARWLDSRADRSFLCDSARGERSGVLLI